MKQIKTNRIGRSLLLVSSLSTLGLMPAQAVTLLADDFTTTSVSTTTDGFRLRESSIDQGWQAARQGGGSAWTVASGTLQNASTVTGGGYPNYIPGEAPVAQAISLAGLGVPDGDTQITISFDFSVAAGDTLFVTLWGHTGPFDSGSSNIFANLEGAFGLANNEGTSTLDAFNLLDGATTGFGGSTNPLATLAGGTSGTFSTSIDLATLGITGVSKVNDLSVLTLGFGKMEDGLAGTTSLANLDIASIPEPSASALLALAGIAFLRVRRRKRGGD